MWEVMSGVEKERIVYKGFGRGINKPMERLAAIRDNGKWFVKYIRTKRLRFRQLQKTKESPIKIVENA